MKTNKKYMKYSPEFKISVILDMLNNHLGYGEVIRKALAIRFVYIIK